MSLCNALVFLFFAANCFISVLFYPAATARSYDGNWDQDESLIKEPEGLDSTSPIAERIEKTSGFSLTPGELLNLTDRHLMSCRMNSRADGLKCTTEQRELYCHTTRDVAGETGFACYGVCRDPCINTWTQYGSADDDVIREGAGTSVPLPRSVVQKVRDSAPLIRDAIPIQRSNGHRAWERSTFCANSSRRKRRQVRLAEKSYFCRNWAQDIGRDSNTATEECDGFLTCCCLFDL